MWFNIETDRGVIGFEHGGRSHRIGSNCDCADNKNDAFDDIGVVVAYTAARLVRFEHAEFAR
jgi:hypothetical protein